MKFPLHLILEYAAKTPREMERGAKEFFGNSVIGTLEEEDMVLPLFNDWIVFDFKLQSGATPLGEYVLINPDGLDQKIISRFRQIAESQRYSQFEATDIRFNQWIVLEDLFTGAKYQVWDKSMSRSRGLLGAIIHARAGKVDGKWYLVGANPIGFGIKYSDRAKKLFRKNMAGYRPSPKDTARLILDHSKDGKKAESPGPARSPTPGELKAKRADLEKQFTDKAKIHQLKTGFDSLLKSVYEETDTNVLDLWLKLEKGAPAKKVRLPGI